LDAHGEEADMTVILQKRCCGCGKVQSDGRWGDSQGEVARVLVHPIAYVDSYCPPCLRSEMANVIKWKSGSNTSLIAKIQSVA
jgi:hypothetical protein